MNITIKDVAKAANVSVATVSRVLNKKTNVSEEAVQAALDEVKQSRIRFRTTSTAKMQEQREKLEKKPGPEGGGG